MKTMMAISGAILLTAALAAHAQVLKCVGKDGRVEFASSCPPGTKQTDTGVSNKPAPAPAKSDKGDKGDKGDKAASKAGDKAAPKSLAERDMDFKKRQSEQQEAAAKSEKESQERAQRQRACESAQGNLQSLKSRQRTFRVDPKTGERSAYEEADFVREQQIAERQVADFCR
jgi:hypothetical protein